jgi:large subunit ribosomal protein L23
MGRKESREIIIRPILSEKSVSGTNNLKYTFEIEKDANKIEVKKAIEEIFKVKVEKVNISYMRGKKKWWKGKLSWTKDWKKAVVTLKPGYKIEIFEGV